MDYVGLVLYSGGLVLVLLGLCRLRPIPCVLDEKETLTCDWW